MFEVAKLVIMMSGDTTLRSATIGLHLQYHVIFLNAYFAYPLHIPRKNQVKVLPFRDVYIIFTVKINLENRWYHASDCKSLQTFFILKWWGSKKGSKLAAIFAGVSVVVEMTFITLRSVLFCGVFSVFNSDIFNKILTLLPQISS